MRFEDLPPQSVELKHDVGDVENVAEPFVTVAGQIDVVF